MFALIRPLLVALALFAHVSSAEAQIVISEIYGSGGESGAVFNRDFVEIFNNGTTSQSLNGWKLEYFIGNLPFSTTIALDNVTLSAREIGIIQLGNSGTNGVNLPSLGTVVATSTENIAGTDGRVRLLNGANAVQDLVGYGSVTNFEGTGPAPAGSATLSVARRTSGLFTPFLLDSGNNNTDFFQSPPSPGVVPEPGSMVLVGLTVGAVVGWRQRSRKKLTASDTSHG